MVKCPKCKKEITRLNHYESGEMHYYFMLSEDSVKYESRGFQSDSGTTDYECPECAEVLFTDEEKAGVFLKGNQNKRGKKNEIRRKNKPS